MKLNRTPTPLRWKLIRRGGIFLAIVLGGLALADNWLPYGVADEPKQLYPIVDADHADMISTGGEALKGEILQFLQGAIATQASAVIAP